MTQIYPILLAGGSGTRLWPLSRKSYPKQFSNLIGEKSLFQQSALRLTSSDQIQFAPHITLTNSDFRFIVTEQMQAVGLEPGPVLIEPEAKNTAPAILAASIFAYNQNKDAVLLVAPSDHIIPDDSNFHDAVLSGLPEVEKGKVVTFGIKPTKAETGYGYLELSPNTDGHKDVAGVARFWEKPDVNRAQEMLASGNFLWNSGIFLFKASDMISLFRSLEAEMVFLVQDAVSTATSDLGFLRLNHEPWAKVQGNSIDYAIMEKAQNLMAVKYQLKWSDLGGWDAVWEEAEKDAQGNVIRNEAYPIDCKNTLLRAEGPEQKIVGIGLENIVAVAMSDSVLIADKNKAQNVKQAVALLKNENVSQAEILPIDHRPWGWFESLIVGERFQVKRIHVKPGAALSLQSHKYRSEHWIVVQGTAEVTVDDNISLVTEGQSVYVPLGAIHRMKNPGKLPMLLIEVQIGSYLGEDDIVRYEDDYQRI